MKSCDGDRQLCLALPLFTAAQKEGLMDIEAKRKTVSLSRKEATLHKFLSIITFMFARCKAKLMLNTDTQRCFSRSHYAIKGHYAIKLLDAFWRLCAIINVISVVPSSIMAAYNDQEPWKIHGLPTIIP